MVSCVACDLECGDVERLETHWEQSHPSLAELNRSIERIRRQTPASPRCAQCDILFPSLSAWYTHIKADVCCESETPSPRRPTSKHTMRSTSLYYDFPKEEEEGESTPLIERPSRPVSPGLCGFWAMMKPKQVMSKLKKRRQVSRRYSVM
ncbi:hypothetical protein CPB85DRAFT_1252397 [Mucidula mucida]|nr:hypothetical protein CPB85DRAFT_1252397 [Mucidula mucida]